MENPKLFFCQRFTLGSGFAQCLDAIFTELIGPSVCAFVGIGLGFRVYLSFLYTAFTVQDLRTPIILIDDCQFTS